MAKLLKSIKKEENKTLTENGALAYNSTTDAIVDFFGIAGAMRTKTHEDISKIFRLAYAENPDIAVKLLFYFRDIRGGQGERRVFRIILDTLVELNPQIVINNLELIPEYGRWDDLVILLNNTKNEDVKASIITLFKKTIHQDAFNVGADKPISLLGKWLPSENASSENTKKLARLVRTKLGFTSREYRILLSRFRRYIKIVETNLVNKTYNNIEYDKVPSRASMIYRKAFSRNDGERYKKYLEDVKSGVKEIKASTLYPMDIVKKYFVEHYNRGYNSGIFKTIISVDDTLEALWKALPDYFAGKFDNSLVLCDTSGSMHNPNFDPISTSLSLAIYMAERNKGIFHNHFLTFSVKPKLQECIGNTLAEKISNMDDQYWGGNTDLMSAFELILNTAINNKLKQKDLPSSIYIISDMQFDDSSSSNADFNNRSLFKNIKIMYKNKGYELPKVIYWQVSGRLTNFPVKIKSTESGALLISGLSPSIIKFILSGANSQWDLIKSIVESDRYSGIKV